METGVLLLDKPSGITSAKALERIKSRFKIKKMGHAGTLDPMATGLLICLVGKATKLASHFEGGRKVYSGTIRFGVTTDSDDITGVTTSESQEIPSFEVIKDLCEKFLGSIQQTPPSVSAVKVNGRRAYSLVRDSGITPTLSSRSVEIFRFEVIPEDSRTIRFEIECSKGTYIRSIARDLGALAGCGACLHSLRRESSDPFSVAMAKGFDEITESDFVNPTTIQGIVSREERACHR